MEWLSIENGRSNDAESVNGYLACSHAFVLQWGEYKKVGAILEKTLEIKK